VCDRGAAQGISPKSSGPQEMIIPALGAAVASDFIGDFRIRMWPALTFPARLYLAHLSPHPDHRPQVSPCARARWLRSVKWLRRCRRCPAAAV